MYRSVIDSGWVQVVPLTVLVGKNESGKTSLLRALHKFKPFTPEPYRMENEWPRGCRKERNPNQVVCSVRFELTASQRGELEKLTGEAPGDKAVIEMDRTYAGTLTTRLPTGYPKAKLTEAEIEKQIHAHIADPAAAVGSSFRGAVLKSRDTMRAYAVKNAFSVISFQAIDDVKKLQAAMSAEEAPERAAEQQICCVELGRMPSSLLAPVCSVFARSG
jgi:predicted ATP-dependent endonuclease of OLD family